MNEQTAKLLEQLASKMGTTAEYLWGVLVNQAPISALTSLLIIIGVIVLGVVIWRIHKVGTKKEWYDDYEGFGIAMVIMCLIWSLFLLGAFIEFPNVVNGFFNPEYWALNELLDKVS